MFNFVEEILKYNKDSDSEKAPKVINRHHRLQRSLTSEYTAEAFTVLGSAEFGSISNVRELALNPFFMGVNEEFVKQGELIRICLNKGYVPFAEELVKAGYLIPDDILLKAIKQDRSDLVHTILSAGLYNSSQVILEFWYLIDKGLTFHAEILFEKEVEIQRYLNFNFQEFNTVVVIKAALRSALDRKHGDLSSYILKLHPDCLDLEIVDIALKKNDLGFLRKVWTGDLNDLTAKKPSERKRKNKIWQTLNQIHFNDERNSKKCILDIGYILRHFLAKKMMLEVKQIISWPEVADDPNVLKICIELKEEEMGRNVISKRRQEVKKVDFELAFKNHCFWLCLDMLKWKEPKTYFLNKKIQKILLEMLKNGETCYFAAEMIVLIEGKFWHPPYTKELCEVVTYQLKKTYEIAKCPFPLLYLVLVGEFLQKIIPFNIIFSGICRSTLGEILLLARCIEDSIKEELELKYLLCCTDTQNRSVLSIIAANGFYSLLENNDVGSVITNLWIGDRKHNGLMPASTLYSAFYSPTGSDDKLIFLKKLNTKKAYMFQYQQLESSCQLRLFGQMVSTIFLVYFYTMVIYTATVAGAMEDIAKDSTALGFLRLSQVWIIGVFLENLLMLLFFSAVRRKIIVDLWIVNDFFMALMMIFLMSGANQKYSGNGKLLDFVSATDFNIIMHGLALCLIWLRFFKVLLTTASYGPLLKIIYKMSRSMGTFIILFFGLIFVGSSIMNCIFATRTTSGKFISFGTSITTLFRMSLGDTDITDYSEYVALGGILESILVAFLNILMINILIALLTIVYQSEHDGEESRFRATIILEYYKWSWDANYGILIMMPSPISILSTVIAPFLLVSYKPRAICNGFSKVFFFLYALPMFAYFAAVSAVFVPIVYLSSLTAFAKGGVKKAKFQSVIDVGSDDSESDEELDSDIAKIKVFSSRRAVVWLIAGWIFCVVAYFRDLFHFWTVVYKEVDQIAVVSEEFEVNSAFLKILQETLTSISGQEIELDEFISRYQLFESSTMSKIQLANTEQAEIRLEKVRNLFEYWLSSKKSQKINLSYLKSHLPSQNYYSEQYITRTSYIRIQWILKALKFYVKSATIKLKQVKLPKSTLLNATFQIKAVLSTSKRAFQLCKQLKYNFSEISRLKALHA